MKPEGSMPHSQALSNNSYPEPNQPQIRFTVILSIMLSASDKRRPILETFSRNSRSQLCIIQQVQKLSLKLFLEDISTRQQFSFNPNKLLLLFLCHFFYCASSPVRTLLTVLFLSQSRRFSLGLPFVLVPSVFQTKIKTRNILHIIYVHTTTTCTH